MNIFVYLDGVSGQMTLDDSRRDAMLVVVIHHIVGGDEGRNISTGFGRKIAVDLPIVFLAFASGTAQSLVDVTRTAVVGRYGKRPVIIDLIKLFKITGGVTRRQTGIAALVDQRVDFHSEPFGRCRHELPQACCSCTRNGVGVNGRFNYRKILQFGRHTLFQQFFHENRTVVTVEGKHISHQRAALGEIHIDIVPYNRVIGQLDLGRESLEPLLIFSGSGGLRRSEVNARNHIILQIKILLKQTGLRLEAFRSYYIVIGNRVLYLKYGLSAHDTHGVESDGKYCDKD